MYLSPTLDRRGTSNVDGMGRLDNRVAIVTGAGRGIGKAIAKGFAREGALVVCSARTVSEIEETASEIRSEGAEAFAAQVDITDLDSVRGMFDQAVRTAGKPDILVLAAGGSLHFEEVDKGSPENWRNTIETNLMGTYFCAHVGVPYLKGRGTGKVIIVGSGIGSRGHPGSSAHACAKAGVHMLTRILAQELSGHDISVNELIPGPVLTETGASYSNRSNQSVFSIESEWVKEPQDVVPLALFLATQPDRGPSGQTFSLMRRDP